MKKMLENIREVIDELRKDIDIFLAIRRYERISRREKGE